MQLMMLMSDILRVEKDAVARSLRFRTFGIIPLGPRLGLIQWVPDSRPIAELCRFRDKFDAYRSRGVAFLLFFVFLGVPFLFTLHYFCLWMVRRQ